MTSAAVFHYIEGYIFTLLILELLLSAGLKGYISASINVVPPTLPTPPTPSNNTWWDAIVGLFDYIIYFFQNIGFLFSLVLTSNFFSGFQLLGWIFTFMTIMFIISIIMVIRG